MKDYIKTNQKVYDALASEYGQKVEHYKKAKIKLCQPFIDELKVNFVNPTILELGCGAGLHLMYLEQEKFKTTAIDISKKMIKESKKIAFHTTYIYDEFLAHDFKKVKFCGIFAHSFIHLFTKKDATSVMKKINDLLKNKGILFIGTTKHKKSREGYITKHDYQSSKLARFRREWKKEDLLKFLKNFGFKILQIDEFEESDKQKSWIWIILKKIN